MNQDDIIADYVRQLFEPGAPALLHAPELEGVSTAGTRVFIAARHGPVCEILEDETSFSLIQYDRLLAQVAGPTRYFVGENTAGRRERVEILQKAQAWVAESIPCLLPPPTAGSLTPTRHAAYLAWVAAIARKECRNILNILKQRSGTDHPVNLVREYGFLVAFRTARRLLGISAPDRPPVMALIIMTLRNLLAPGPWIRMRGELGAAMSFLTLLLPLFAHVFGTIVASPVWLSMPAKWAARTSLGWVDDAIANCGQAPAQSLLAAMMAVRPQFKNRIDDETYNSHVRSILFELAGAMVLIVGKSMAEICGLLSSPVQSEKAGVGWDQAIALLRQGEANGKEQQTVLKELLRIAADNRLLRTVRNKMVFHGVQLNAEDKVLVLTNSASHDPAAFPSPDAFKPQTDREYITFGPLGGPHACFGQFIARTMIREMLVSLDGVLEPGAGCELKVFLGLPDDLAWQVCKPAASRRTADAGRAAAAPRRARSQRDAQDPPHNDELLMDI